MMDKTIKINLGGSLFQIDEEAYRMLRDYLQAIDLKFRNVPGGNETCDDIESRIAEIFGSQKGSAGIISRENVEAMIAIIGKPEDFIHTETEEPNYTFTSQKKRMYRNPDDAVISGVSGGIGAYLGTDPVWIRILFIVFTFFFGIGFFVYVALWIALPSARSDSQKKELYGSDYYAKSGGNVSQPPYATTSKVGHAVNEVFLAIGKVLFIIVRIFMIIFGVLFVITGFLALLAWVMVFIFKFPGAFSTDAIGINVSYLPDFLNYIVTPSIVPWITVLFSLVVILPLLALIYGGVKMIFWFKARDGVFLLSGLVLWVLSCAALAIVLFNEGFSFAESARSTTQDYFKAAPDTLYIVTQGRIKTLKYDKEVFTPESSDFDNIYISDQKKEIYERATLSISSGEHNSSRVDIIKRSSGRSRMDAIEKSEKLKYNFKISGDTLYIDEYFTIPSERKWSFDNVRVDVYIPEGTIVYMDRTAQYIHYYHDVHFYNDGKKGFFKLTEDGLEYFDPDSKEEN
jgi:phage shock protein PspC (stress-responsive transcriptional regulator)